MLSRLLQPPRQRHNSSSKQLRLRKTSQTFASIHDAPDDVQRNLAQIEQLIISLSRLIISNKAVQTDSIDSILRLCLRDSARLQVKLKVLIPATDAGKIEQQRKAFMATFKKDAFSKTTRKT